MTLETPLLAFYHHPGRQVTSPLHPVNIASTSDALRASSSHNIRSHSPEGALAMMNHDLHFQSWILAHLGLLEVY